jgi:peptidoglycan/LPS O-acetylase OafA/YrhL
MSNVAVEEKQVTVNHISNNASLFFDMLRIIATLTVLINHAYIQWAGANLFKHRQIDDAGHAAVIIFFVLSGYVIAYTANKSNRGWRQYAQARLSRLCSVVIPALVITGIIEIGVRLYEPAFMSGYSRGLTWQRYIFSGFFLNETWFFSAAPRLNGPLWSLSFEFWYYAIFGCWIYSGKGIKSIILPLIACIIAGPKILLMMPIWLAGCAAYRLPKPVLSTQKAWALITICILGAVLSVLYVPSYPYTLGIRPLFFAGQFTTDWITGIFVATAFWLLPLSNSTVVNTPKVKLIRRIADFTFPIYVLHNPLLFLLHLLLRNQPANFWQMPVAIALVIIVGWVIGLVMEAQRPLWINGFKYVLGIGKAQDHRLNNI